MKHTLDKYLGSPRKKKACKIIIANTQYKISYFWVQTLEKLGIMHRLSFDEINRNYCLSNENARLRAAIVELARETLQKKENK